MTDVLANLSETLRKAASSARGMCAGRYKHSKGEAETKTVERGGIPLVQQKKRGAQRRPLFTVVAAYMCCQWPKPVDYVMLTERGNGVCRANQVIFSTGGGRGGERSGPREGAGEFERLTVSGAKTDWKKKKVTDSC